MKSCHSWDQYWQLSWYWPLAGGSAVVGRGLPESVFLSQPPPLAMCVWAVQGVFTMRYIILSCSHQNIKRLLSVTIKNVSDCKIVRKEDMKCDYKNHNNNKNLMSVIVGLLLFVERITLFTWMDSLKRIILYCHFKFQI